MKIKYRLAAIIILITGLFFTNPGISDFENYAERNLKEKVNSKSKLENLAVDFIAPVIGWWKSANVSRKEYYLFSTYETNKLAGEELYVGIFNTFFKIK